MPAIKRGKKIDDNGGPTCTYKLIITLLGESVFSVIMQASLILGVEKNVL